MADQVIRTNLTSTGFPFYTDQGGRTIILPQYDQNVDKGSVLALTDKERDRGIPQAFYMHNCMPTTEGYQSIGYTQLLGAMAGTPNDFDQTFNIAYVGPPVVKALFVPAAGKNYVYDATVGIWAQVPVMGAAGFSATPSTTASILDFTYVDRSVLARYGETIYKLGAYLTTAQTISLKVLERTAANNYTVLHSVTVAHTGTGWEDFATAYTMPASGDIYLGVHVNNAATDVNAATDTAYISGNATGASAGWTESASANCPAVRASCDSLTVDSTALVTEAHVNGTSYIYYEQYGCFVYNPTTKQFDMVTLVGLDLAVVKGLCASNGYLVAWGDTTLAWSNVSDPTDFVPSSATGASGGTVQQARGIISFCAPVSNGFLVYCEQNTVSATYQQNINYPWLFNEIPASGGCESPRLASYQSNAASHYVWTTSGLQEISRTQSQAVYPALTDFLASRLFEDFDDTTFMFTLEELGEDLYFAIASVADRYVVVSYGKQYPEFSYALVFDLSLKRWGKLKLAHRHCFEWTPSSLYGETLYGSLVNTPYSALSSATYNDLSSGVSVTAKAKRNIAFLQADGTVLAVNFDTSLATSRGVLMLGKFQFERGTFVSHQISEVESVKTGAVFDFYIIPTLDGKTLLTPQQPTKLYEGSMLRKYGLWYTAANITAMFVGSFNLVSYLLRFTKAGRS